MRKLLLLSIFMGCASVANAAVDVFVKVVQGQSFDDARVQLNNAGWQVSGFVDTDKVFTVSKPSFTFLFNGVTHTLDDVGEDSAFGEADAAEAAIRAQIDSTAVEFDSLEFGVSLELNGVPTVALVDTSPVYPASSPALLGGTTVGYDFLTKNIAMTDLYSDPEYYGIIASKPQWWNLSSRFFDNYHASAVAAIAAQSGINNGSPVSITSYGLDNRMPLLSDNPDKKTALKSIIGQIINDPNSFNRVAMFPLGTKVKIGTDLEGTMNMAHLRDEQMMDEVSRLSGTSADILPLVSAGNSVDSTIKKQIRGMTASRADVLVIGEHCVSNGQIIPNCEPDPLKWSCPIDPSTGKPTIDATIDTGAVSYQFNSGFNNMMYTATASGTSGAVGIMGAHMDKMRKQFPHVHSRDIAIAVRNSTRIANNLTTKDACLGWGRFDYDATAQYVAANYPVRTWTPNWVAGGSPAAIYPHFAADLKNSLYESCLVNVGGKIVDHPASQCGGSSTCQTCSYNNTPNAQLMPIYVDAGKLTTPTGYSAYPNGIPTNP